MSWKATIKKESWKSTIQSDWKRTALSIVPPVPTTKEKIKSEIISMIMPELKEKTSWKNSLSIEPKNGIDGRHGKDGKKGAKGERGEIGPQGISGINGTNGIDGKPGIDGATWHLVDKAPDEIGSNGDFAFSKSNFEIYFKENDEWTSLGTIKGQNKTAFVGGLNGANGLSAYEIAVRNGFSGTESEWLASLGSAQVELAQIIDEASATVTYIGKAQPGSLEASAVWQIKKIEIVGSETIINFADGNADFDNVWDNRAGLSFS